MLRLVHPSPEGNGGDPPIRRRHGAKPPALFLTPEETRHARAALRNTARAYGTFGCLADAMGMPVRTLHRAMRVSRSFSGTLAIRLAKAAGVTVEAMLTGKLNTAGRCATCGHRAGDGRLLAAGGAS